MRRSPLGELDLSRERVDLRKVGLREFQRFGADGPIYQVLGIGAALQTVRVRVLDTGEEFDYRLADARNDPPA